MSTSSSKAAQDLAALRSTVTTTTSLIARLQTSAALTETPAALQSAIEENNTKNAINALELAYDTASLIRAHSTKLSLLILNKPFTATAISTVLQELVAQPLPGLASAVEICNPAKYTKAVSEELQWRSKIVFIELGSLVKSIPLDGTLPGEDRKSGTGLTSGRDILASTGVVWQACDALMELKTLGIAGLAIKKVEQYRDLVKDALEELREWTVEESEEKDDGDQSGEENETAQDAVDIMFAAQGRIPHGDPDKIRDRLELSLKRLRLVILMYQAVIKRRLKTFPALPHPELPPELKAKSSEDTGVIQCLDEVLSALKKIPDVTDELASAFYDLNSAEIDKRMDECFFTAFSATELLVTNWEGQKDEFSTWAYKFQIEMKNSS